MIHSSTSCGVTAVHFKLQQAAEVLCHLDHHGARCITHLLLIRSQTVLVTFIRGCFSCHNCASCANKGYIVYSAQYITALSAADARLWAVYERFHHPATSLIEVNKSSRGLHHSITLSAQQWVSNSGEGQWTDRQVCIASCVSHYTLQRHMHFQQCTQRA